MLSDALVDADGCTLRSVPIKRGRLLLGRLGLDLRARWARGRRSSIIRIRVIVIIIRKSIFVIIANWEDVRHAAVDDGMGARDGEGVSVRLEAVIVLLRLLLARRDGDRSSLGGGSLAPPLRASAVGVCRGRDGLILISTISVKSGCRSLWRDREGGAVAAACETARRGAQRRRRDGLWSDKRWSRYIKRWGKRNRNRSLLWRKRTDSVSRQRSLLGG